MKRKNTALLLTLVLFAVSAISASRLHDDTKEKAIYTLKMSCAGELGNQEEAFETCKLLILGDGNYRCSLSLCSMLIEDDGDINRMPQERFAEVAEQLAKEDLPTEQIDSIVWKYFSESALIVFYFRNEEGMPAGKPFTIRYKD